MRHPIKAPMLCAVMLALALPVGAQTLNLDFPAPASQTFSRQKGVTSFALPVGPFANDTLQTLLLEGPVSQTAWSLQAKGMTTLEILAPLRAQLMTAGYEVLFECETFACGGFDFRFQIAIVDEPAMHVDLGDFRYLAAKRVGKNGTEHIALLVSKSASLGFVQMTQIGNAAVTAAPTPTPAPAATEPSSAQAITPFEVGLEQQGSVSLDDLIFASGAADLAEGEYASLASLADYLRANPDKMVVLVGHTDASGGLAGNIALSQQRAASVRARMIDTYAIPPGQIAAEGVGYLAPRDSNLTVTGQTRNRRVEVVLMVGQ